jgi:hypothetical protein
MSGHRRQPARRLVVGEVVQIMPGGPTYLVTRVNDCAATLKPRSRDKVLVTVGERSFMAYETGSTIHVSPHAFVYREEEKAS